MKKVLLILAVTISAACVMANAVTGADVDNSLVKNLLGQLDDSLADRDRFIAKRMSKINQLKAELDKTDDRLKLIDQLITQYTSFNNDSAMYYATIGIEMSDGVDAEVFRLKRAALLPLAGFFETAIREFQSVDSMGLPDDLKIEYYEAGRKMYSYINTMIPDYARYNDSIKQSLVDMHRGLLYHLSDSSIEQQFVLAQYYMLIGDYGKAEVILRTILDGGVGTLHYRARVAHHMATIANRAGNENEYIYYLALSAMADVTSATLEVKALQELGGMLFKYGDVDRAYDYLSKALDNAVACGASMRMVESARALPLIEQAHTAQINNHKRFIYIVLAVLIVLTVALATLLIFFRREMNRMKLLQQNLRAANDVKEVYISQFLSLCSIYMDKISDFSKLVYRKLSVGKADELLSLTKSGKLVEEQSREFYEVFDNAFLHLYPGFVEQVNKLLRDDAKLELKEGELLNTELRILAFMRLGIQDSQRIARILHYSLNTIYAYRNRIKNRAENRETFEADVMSLSAL